MLKPFALIAISTLSFLTLTPGFTQLPPSSKEVADYGALHLAVHHNKAEAVEKLLAEGANPNLRDSLQRTPVHIAAHASAYDSLRVLVRAGADIQAMDFQQYDAITIAAVSNDVPMLKLAIGLGGDPTAVTSPYEGTALIAAAHLGHVEVVKMLIKAGAPLDHVNNLNWTALIEAVILGDGGKNHIDIVRVLVAAGADRNIADREGITPFQYAKRSDYDDIIDILKP